MWSNQPLRWPVRLFLEVGMNAVQLLWSKTNLRVLFAIVMVAAVLAALPRDSQGAPPSPSLELSAPRQVALSQAIEIKLTLKNAADIAGYEANVLFDNSAAEFDGLHIRDNDI